MQQQSRSRWNDGAGWVILRLAMMLFAGVSGAATGFLGMLAGTKGPPPISTWIIMFGSAALFLIGSLVSIWFLRVGAAVIFLVAVAWAVFYVVRLFQGAEVDVFSAFIAAGAAWNALLGAMCVACFNKPLRPPTPTATNTHGAYSAPPPPSTSDTAWRAPADQSRH